MDFMQNKFLKQKKELDKNYARRVEEAKKIWEGFDIKTGELEKIISEEFKKVAQEVMGQIYPGGNLELGQIEVKYIPELKKFKIDIQGGKLKEDGQSYTIGHWDETSRGRVACAHFIYEPLTSYDENANIGKFKTNFSIGSISTDCNCGSDHR